jgi:hypothetical protein
LKEANAKRPHTADFNFMTFWKGQNRAGSKKRPVVARRRKYEEG